MKIQLLVLNEGPRKGSAVRLGVREFTIGRDPGCHLRSAHPAVAPRHCVIRVLGSGITIEDLGSPGGTIVNGERIRGKAPLQSGDQVCVGPLAFELAVERRAPARLIMETTDEEAAAMILDGEEAEEPGTGQAVPEQAVVFSAVPAAKPGIQTATRAPQASADDGRQSSSDAARALLVKLRKR